MFKIDTNLVPKLYKYVKLSGKSASIATKPVENIEVKSLHYVPQVPKSMEKINEEIHRAYIEYSISPYINEYLRKGIPMSQKANELYLSLKEGIRRSQGGSGVFYRGINPKSGMPINKDTISNYIFNNAGFTSVSPESQSAYASTFASCKGALVKFEITKPMKAYKASNNYEVLFDTNAFTADKFKIISEGYDNFYRVVQL